MQSSHRIEKMSETVNVFIKIFVYGIGMTAHHFYSVFMKQFADLFCAVELIGDRHLFQSGRSSQDVFHHAYIRHKEMIGIAYT